MVFFLRLIKCILNARKNTQPFIQTENKEDLSKYIRNSYQDRVTYSCDFGKLYDEADFLGEFNKRSVYCNSRQVTFKNMPIEKQIAFLLKMEEIDFEISVKNQIESLSDPQKSFLPLSSKNYKKKPLKGKRKKVKEELNENLMKIGFKLKPNSHIYMIKHGKQILLGKLARVKINSNDEVVFSYKNGDVHGLESCFSARVSFVPSKGRSYKKFFSNKPGKFTFVIGLPELKEESEEISLKVIEKDLYVPKKLDYSHQLLTKEETGVPGIKSTEVKTDEEKNFLFQYSIKEVPKKIIKQQEGKLGFNLFLDKYKRLINQIERKSEDKENNEETSEPKDVV